MSSAVQRSPDAGRSLWSEAWRRLCRRRMTRLCLGVVALYTLTALYAEGVYRFHRWQDRTPSYQQTNLEQAHQSPGRAHWLGTDGLGRDVLQRLAQGTRIAFQVGVVTSLIAIPIGLILGLVAGYFGGRTVEIIVWLYSTFASVPGLLLILAIAMVVGRGLMGVYMGIGLTTWVGLCRLIRAEVIKQRALPYVLAARALGLGSWRIMFRHILPNVLHLVIVTFTLRFPASIGTEVFLSFIGLGAQGEPSWGLMISSARLRLWQGAWWEMTSVSVAILGLVLAFNWLGDALRDALDPRLRTAGLE